MRRIAICIMAAILLLSLVGCGNSGGAEASSAVPEENSTVPQTEPEERGIEGQTKAEPKKSEQGETDSPKQEETPINKESDEEEPMKISVKSADYEIIYELNGSQAAKDLYAQLPLTVEAQPFSNNEMTFYPPEKLDTANTPLSGGEAGSLSYYSPWGDVVMFYAPCDPNGSLYGLGTVVSGEENIDKLSGTIEISVCN